MNISEDYLYIYGCILILYNIIVAYLLYCIWRLKKNYKSVTLQNLRHRYQPTYIIPTCKNVKMKKPSPNYSSNEKTLHDNTEREADASNLDKNNALGEKVDIEKDFDESSLGKSPKVMRNPMLHGITLRFSNVIEQLKMKTGVVNVTKSEEDQYILDVSSVQQEDYNNDMELCDRNEKSGVINNQQEGEVINLDITNGSVVKVETISTATNLHEKKTAEISYDSKNKLGKAILLPNVLEELKIKTVETNTSTTDANPENLNNDFVTSIQESVNETKHLSILNKKKLIPSQGLTNLENIEAKNNESHADTTNMNVNNLQNKESDNVENRLAETQIKDKIRDVVSSLDTEISVEPVYDSLPQSTRKVIFEGDSSYLTFQSSNNSPDNKENYVNAKMRSND